MSEFAFFRSTTALLALTFFSGALCPSAMAAELHIHKNDIPPRFQWNENSGYCGEVSFISAGLYYGQYISQYKARTTVALDARQNQDELLIGVNDQRAAARMHLAVVEWKTARQRTTSQFLQWIKHNVLRGFPVVIGVFNNEYLLYGNTDPAAGDPSYDHIVPVIGVRSQHPFSDTHFQRSDTLIFSDNGLWGTGKKRRYIFRPRFGSFPANRAQANAPGGPVYSLPNDRQNCGVAITGVVDRNHETLPVRLQTNLNFESPQIGHGSNARPPGRPLVLTITVSGLQPGVIYNLYRYDSLPAVPDYDFNAHARQASEIRQIQIDSGTTFTTHAEIDSNEVAVYRAVRAGAR